MRLPLVGFALAGTLACSGAQAALFVLVAGEARMAGPFSAVAPLKTGGALITGGYGNGDGARSSSWLYRG